MDSREYLNYVLDKLQERIRKLDDAILHGQKEIENMHEYYWENYTEMDQYGYEDFDNQQALLGQVNANKEKLDLRRRFKKMLDSPFFGRVDFIYDGEEEAEKARVAAKALFVGGGDDANMPTTEISADKLADGKIGILNLMVACGLAPSNKQARQLVEQGGVLVNDEKVPNAQFAVTEEMLKAGVKIRKGKKIFHKAVLA